MLAVDEDRRFLPACARLEKLNRTPPPPCRLVCVRKVVQSVVSTDDRRSRLTSHNIPRRVGGLLIGRMFALSPMQGLTIPETAHAWKRSLFLLGG
jgi:hypothetical protein